MENHQAYEAGGDLGGQPVGQQAALQSLLKELDYYGLEDMHEILLRNGLYLPSAKGHWLTKKILLKVVAGSVWMPKFSELKVRACPRPPKKLDLMIALNQEIKKK